MKISAGDVMVEFEAIGEGRSGDYDETDPLDIELLRFTVSRMESGEWVAVEDASYCTQVPADTDAETLTRLLAGLFCEVYGPVSAGESIKKLCERLSWITPHDAYATV